MKTLLLSTMLLVSTFVHANCKLPVSEKITIGCTYKCDIYTKARITAVAAKLGYRVKFINLSQKEAPSKVDSIIFPGGADIHPKFYLKDVSPELRAYTESNLHLAVLTEEGKKRDFFEYTLLNRLINDPDQYKKLPILGICRGMQMMSVAQGIPLYLDIKTELGIPNRIRKFDVINFSDDSSLMASLYPDRNQVKGFEMHHQGIRVDYFQNHRDQYPNVEVTAYSNKGKVAEVIEYKDMTALGVQFHPEKSHPKTTYPIFHWLLTKACEFKTSKKGE